MPSLDYSRLSDLYDSYCLFEEDIPFFVELARLCKGPILELMAGTGRVSLPLLARGAALVCVDREPSMLRVLAGKADPQDRLSAPAVGRAVASLICGDVCSLPLRPGFPLILLPFQGFSELTTEGQQRAALSEAHRLLAPAGRFACTMHNPCVRLRTVDGAWHEIGRFVVSGTQETISLRIRASFDAVSTVASGTQEVRRLGVDGRVLETRSLALRFALTGSDRFRALAAAAGFEVEALFGDYARKPYDEAKSPAMIWVLKKA